jgi:hypothetical protein
MLDHRGILINSPLFSLAHLQLGRALVMSGDTSGGRKAYQDFFALWKDANPDIPILENKPMVIVPFSSKQDEWRKLEGIDIRNKFRNGKYKHYRLDSIRPCTYGGMIEQYIRHPEAKSLGPDGKSCTAETRVPLAASAHHSGRDSLYRQGNIVVLESRRRPERSYRLR